MKKIAIVLSATALFASCSSNNKKITVLVKGEAVIDEANKTITAKDAAGNDDKTVSFNSADKITIKVKTADKEASIEIPTNGYYLLNAKNDTIIGSYQNYGAPKKSGDSITQAMILKSIDSLQQLTEGKNVSAANRNFYILPYTAAKITDNADAYFVTPFHQVTSLEKKDGKDPEVYRFWSIKEIREKIEKQKAMTAGEKKEVPAKK